MTDGSWFNSQQKQRICIIFKASDSVLGPNHSPINCVPYFLALGINRLGRETCHTLYVMPKLCGAKEELFVSSSKGADNFKKNCEEMGCENMKCRELVHDIYITLMTVLTL